MHCPQAEIVHDLFHVAAKYGRAVTDCVRVDEANRLRGHRAARKVVKPSRWLLQRNREIPAYDSLPAAIELRVPGVSVRHWVGLTAPKGMTPPAVLEKMSKELERVMRRTEAKNRRVPSGIEPAPGSTADFTAFLN
jgi:hypothetical protein